MCFHRYDKYLYNFKNSTIQPKISMTRLIYHIYIDKKLYCMYNNVYARSIILIKKKVLYIIFLQPTKFFITIYF